MSGSDRLCQLRRQVFRIALGSFVLLGISTVAWAQGVPATQLTAVRPFGGKIGSTFDITLIGTDLDDVTKLSFSHPGITAEPKQRPSVTGKSVPIPSQFTVKINGDVPRGIYEVRAVGRYGTSNPRIFLVDQLSTALAAGGIVSLDKAQAVPLESCVFGTAEKEQFQYYKFTAKKGTRVFIDCWAYRADSRLDATLVLLDTKNHELMRNNDTFRRDPFLDFTVPEDGEYFVQIYDFLYQGGEPDYFYRLSISTGPIVDFIFPTARLPGSQGKYTLYGRNLPGSEKTELRSLDGKPLEKVEVEITLPGDAKSRWSLPLTAINEPASATQEAFLYRLKTPQGDTNPVPIFFATTPVITEQEPNSDAAHVQKINVPSEVAGQFATHGDQDWFEFDAKKGERLYIETYNERLGVPGDMFFRLQKVTKDAVGKEKVTDVVEIDDLKPARSGKRDSAIFDSSTADLTYRLDPPEDARYRLQLRDLFSQSRGGPNYLYRLSVRRHTPDFRLIAIAEPPVVPQQASNLTPYAPMLVRGGTKFIRVDWIRQDNFDGFVTISAEGLPPGVSCYPIVLGSESSGRLFLHAAEDAPAWNGTIRIVGKSQLNGSDVARIARSGVMINPIGDFSQTSPRTRMSQDFALTVSDQEVEPARIVLELGHELRTSLAGTLEIPVKIKRQPDFK
ncbi:MAG: pre-peptidase C-terminal domain-containing protein, partial [Planctomycetota bacterium]|nr:pre-peptidase C-terminal domain-containing protein [Planctomycetota bacterium]